ncbi:copper transport protein ATX1 [Trifolium repens]|nr:copper transport protein ATX1 [Trifolium repens]
MGLFSIGSTQNSVFFPVLETVSKTSCGFTFPFTVTFCSFRSISNDSTPVKNKNVIMAKTITLLSKSSYNRTKIVYCTAFTQ